MNKSTNLRSKVRNVSIKAAAVVTTALVSVPAFAGPMAEAATDGMDVAELGLIGVAVLTMAGVIALIRAGRKAAGG